MLKSLRLVNFKAFTDQTIPLAPLTLLAGLNGMGKSSVLQALLLLRQGLSETSDRLKLNGELIELGNVRDVINEGGESDEFVQIDLLVELDPNSNDDVVFTWVFHNYGNQLLWNRNRQQPDHLLSLFSSDRFTFLPAERIGPRKSYEALFDNTIGRQAQFTVHQLYLLRDTPLSDQRLYHPHCDSNLLLAQVEAWMAEISPGIRFRFDLFQSMDTVQIQYAFTRGRDVSSYYRATNVGFGISYTLPIVVAVLSAKPGDLILMENPEAHLHPKGQSIIGELLARAATAGIQILVETHSDHVLNGIRVATRKGLISPAEVGLNFFQRPIDDTVDSGVEVVTPKLDRHGRLDFWPDGFFDEWDKSLDQLL